MRELMLGAVSERRREESHGTTEIPGAGVKKFCYNVRE
jgi:hypothetical protein